MTSPMDVPDEKRNADAKRLLELVIARLASANQIAVPKPGSFVVLHVEVEPDTGRYTARLGEIASEELGSNSIIPVADLLNATQGCEGQAVLSVYVKGAYVFSELTEVRVTQKTSPGGQE